MAHEIVVVDYHKGNLLSVARSMSAVGAEVVISDDPLTISQAHGIILPGVGSFEDAMRYIRPSGQGDAMVSSIKRGVPFLGICLGLHLLFDRGSEHTSEAWGNGWVPGLGILKGSVTRLESDRLKVPHVGWNKVEYLSKRPNPLFEGIPDGEFFYFTHSYAAPESDATIATTTHSITFPCVAQVAERAFGVQFHPEKSSDAGAKMLANFVKLALSA